MAHSRAANIPNAPTTTTTPTDLERDGDKITSGQTNRIVLSLIDHQVNLAALAAQFDSWPIPGLKQSIVVNGETVIYFWP